MALEVVPSMSSNVHRVLLHTTLRYYRTCLICAVRTDLASATITDLAAAEHGLLLNRFMEGLDTIRKMAWWAFSFHASKLQTLKEEFSRLTILGCMLTLVDLIYHCLWVQICCSMHSCVRRNRVRNSPILWQCIARAQTAEYGRQSCCIFLLPGCYSRTSTH